MSSSRVRSDDLGVGVLAAVGSGAVAAALPAVRPYSVYVAAAVMVLVAVRSATHAVRAPPVGTVRREAIRDRLRADVPSGTAIPAPRVDLRAPETPSGALATTLFTTAKLGALENENEDAAAVGLGGHLVAVADGASSAFAAREWSKLLAERFVSNGPSPFAEGMERFVAECAALWDDATEPEEEADWWVAEAQQRGSFAAFLGIVLSVDHEWEAFVVGDCCVLACDKEGKLLTSFPIDDAAAFTSTPSLLHTADPSSGAWQRTSGRLEPGHALVAASDGLAEWLLTDPSPRLGWLRSADRADAEKRFERERAEGPMVNDDVTVVVVERAVV